MNGTWVDVTGRISWLDNDGNIVDINPERLPSQTSNVVTVSRTYFGQSLTFGMGQSTSSYDPTTDLRASIDIRVPIEFNNLWAPHQSRLIALSSNRKVLSNLLENLNPGYPYPVGLEIVVANLFAANLSETNLTDALVFYEQLAVAYLLTDAIMPDGTKNDGRFVTGNEGIDIGFAYPFPYP